MKSEHKKKWAYGLGSGLLMALLANLCCTAPAVLAFLGLSGLGASLRVANGYGALFGLALALIIGMIWKLRKSKAASCQQCHSRSWKSLAFPVAAVAIFISGYLVLTEPRQNLDHTETQISTSQAPGLETVRCSSCEK